MKKKMIVGVLVSLFVCAFVFAATNYKVTKTCRRCGAEKTVTITADKQTTAESTGRKEIIVTHDDECPNKDVPHLYDKTRYAITSYVDNCCPAY